jgi:endo-1,4-beta-xylanase
MLSGLIARGVPIHGVGFQYHLESGWRAEQEHSDNLNRFARLGLETLVTEADFRIKNADYENPEKALAVQAASYKDLIALCRNSQNCKGALLWGITDKYSWVPGFFKDCDNALILDRGYRPKPAYYAIAEALS